MIHTSSLNSKTSFNWKAVSRLFRRQLAQSSRSIETATFVTQPVSQLVNWCLVTQNWEKKQGRVIDSSLTHQPLDNLSA